MSQNESQTAATEENDKRIQEIVDSQNLDDSTKEQWKSAMGSWTTNDFVYDDETIISLLSDEKLLTAILTNNVPPMMVSILLGRQLEQRKLQQEIQKLT